MFRLFFMLVLILLLCLPVSAAQITSLPQDFTPLEGIIVKNLGREYLIDLDADSGVKIGDIVAVVGEKEKIVHPETNQVLGVLEKIQGFLQVVRLKKGYSHAASVGEVSAFTSGQQIKRFEHVPAQIGASVPEALASKIKNLLPHLDWNTDSTLLSFDLTGDQLSIKSDNSIFYSQYSVASDDLPVVTSAPVITAKIQNNIANVPLAFSETTSASAKNVIEADARPGIVPSDNVHKNSDHNVWRSFPIEGKPVGVACVDIENDGRQEIVIALRDQIRIVRIVAHKPEDVQVFDYPVDVEIIGVDAADLNGDGFGEVYINVKSKDEFHSQVLTFQNHEYKVIYDNLPWYLRVLQVNDKRILVGQKFNDRNKPLSGAIEILQQQPAGIVSTGTIGVGKDLSIFSLSSITSDGNAYAFLSKNDNLKAVTSSGSDIWESEENYGGSMHGFFKMDPENLDNLTPQIYIQPKIVRLGSGEILVPQNIGRRYLQRYRNFKKSRVVAFKWDGYEMRDVWHTVDRNGFLADITAGDADNDGNEELITVIGEQENGFFKKNKTYILLYELI